MGFKLLLFIVGIGFICFGGLGIWFVDETNFGTALTLVSNAGSLIAIMLGTLSILFACMRTS